MYDKEIAIAQPRRPQSAFDRPALKPFPPHVKERLTKNYRYFSLATPLDVLRATISPIGAALQNKSSED